MVVALLAVVIFAGGVTVLSLSGRTTSGPPAVSASAATLARRDVKAFLARYVAADGRVVRWDQGGTTVSEGQAYALLLSVAIGDRREFARVWTWEQRNLQLPDRLFAYEWANGKVESDTPATDADLETAWALVLAGQRFGRPVYTSAGEQVADGVLLNETVTVNDRLELVAGPWARTDPAVVDASYLAPEAISALAAATKDPGWEELSLDSSALVSELESHSPAHLPSDWARLAPSGAISPAAGASSAGGTPTYGLDAQRVPVWFAADCSNGSRALASVEWPALKRAAGHGGRISYSLRGQARSSSVNPLGYVAAAAAADAAGDHSAGRSLLEKADRQNALHHTYYGAAWLALGLVLLDTTWLSTCPPG